MPQDEAVDAAEETADARDPLFLPFQIAIRAAQRTGRTYAWRRRHNGRSSRRGRPRCPSTWTSWLRCLNDHALGEEAGGTGSSFADQAQVAHHFGPETRVDQMQDGVLDPTDVLIDRKPVVDLFGGVEGCGSVVRARGSGKSTTTSPQRYPWCRFPGGLGRRTRGQVAFTKEGTLGSAASHPAE